MLIGIKIFYVFYSKRLLTLKVTNKESFTSNGNFVGNDLVMVPTALLFI
jgi:hypothetical protein